MSRAFVREDDAEQAGNALPERPRSPHTNYVTAQGFSQLREKLLVLMDRKTELSERDDMESKQQTQVVERDLRYFHDRLESAIVVNPETQPAHRVHFGATVQVIDEEDKKLEFQIVGEDEADVARGKISWVSPLAKALLDAEVGDVVVWQRPAGNQELEVVSIRKQVAASVNG
jgi:transcription elongation GreA/GreB family factor